MKTNDIVVSGAVRTPIGRFGGSLKDVPAWELGGAVIKASLERAGLAPEYVDEAVIGQCRQAGSGPNPARTAALKGGLPVSTPAYTVNMACPSGMKSLMLAAEAILAGRGEVFIAGGMENMSSIPFLLKNVRWEPIRGGDIVIEDGWSDSVDPVIDMGMGLTAENLREKYAFSRGDLDAYSLESQRRTAYAREHGWFKDEIVPLTVPARGKIPEFTFAEDENGRPDVTLEKLAKLKPSFKADGIVTPGNSCGLADGAAAMLVTTRDRAEELGIKPLFSIVSYASVAVENKYMGLGPAAAIPAALKQAGEDADSAKLIRLGLKELSR